MAYMFVSEKTGKPLGKKSRKRSAKRKPAARSAKPARFSAMGKSSYNQSRMVARILNKTSELKINPLEKYSTTTPRPSVPLPGTGPIYYTQYCLGNVPSGWTNFDALGGFEFEQGTGPNQRIGKYMYLKKTTMHLKISMNNLARIASQVRFRIVVYKSKRNNVPGTFGGNPSEHLFIDSQGREFGVDNTISNSEASMEYTTALVNRKNYVVLKDTQFILTPQSYEVQGGSNVVSQLSQNGRTEKTMRFELGHYAKTSFDLATKKPTDLAYQYCVSIIAMPVGNVNDRASDWFSAVRGTVSALDN